MIKRINEISNLHHTVKGAAHYDIIVLPNENVTVCISMVIYRKKNVYAFYSTYGSSIVEAMKTYLPPNSDTGGALLFTG